MRDKDSCPHEWIDKADKADKEEADKARDREERDRAIEKKIKEEADRIAPGMSDKITFISC